MMRDRGTAHPSCTDIVPVEMLSTDETQLIIQLIVLAVGILSNGILLLLQCGRAKLSTTCFTYLRILAIFQLAFFLVPYPLKIISDNYQRGQSWISANFLPVLLGDWHFAIACVVLSFSFRVQVIVSYVRRSRRWNSMGWIAWRKVCWIIPFGTIINVSLCFEYNLDIQFCIAGNNTETVHAIGTAKLSETAKQDQLKLNVIRAVPTIVFWLTTLVTFLFVLQERCVLPKLSSPFSAKHLPLMRNLKPLLLAMVSCQCIVHLPSTYHIVVLRASMDEELMLLLYAISYASPPVVMLILSKGLRNHLCLITSKILENRREEDIAQSGGSGKRRSSTLLAFSKLEMENSEIDDRYYTISHGLRTMLKDDIYRVRFAMPSAVPVIEEEDETERRVDLERMSHASDQIL